MAKNKRDVIPIIDEENSVPLEPDQPKDLLFKRAVDLLKNFIVECDRHGMAMQVLHTMRLKTDDFLRDLTKEYPNGRV